MPAPVRIDANVERGTAFIRLRGNLDLYSLDTVDEHVRPFFRDHLPIELDLSGVSFMDSAGLGAIVSLCRRADEAGLPLMIGAALSPQVSRLLRLTGMMSRLPMHDQIGVVTG